MGVKAVADEKARPVPGRGVTVRAAVPGDAEDLGLMFSRCSAETIHLRFHSPYPRIPRAMLDRMADVDPRFGKAYVAEIDGEVIGHVMYAREQEGDTEADTAVVVEDAWASRGVGRRLFARICEVAGRDGVETLLCTTLGDNYRMRDAFAALLPRMPRRLLPRRVPHSPATYRQACFAPLVCDRSNGSNCRSRRRSIDGARRRSGPGEYQKRVRAVLEAQAKRWGVRSQPPVICPPADDLSRRQGDVGRAGVPRACVDPGLVALVNRRVAALNGCEF